ncbi:MAG: transporter substrate-binding domain-containing protein [Pelagimonas sp.]|jgi:polar amino acid transport system substrate-binding protein|nr:transporter substrate-binding domain-containing protein [Pelagimonas sp.]
MKKLLIGTAALAMMAGAAMADGHGKTVRLGTEGAYEPWNFVNDSGEIDGFERELGDELCKRANLTCEWVKNDWDSIIPNLTGGNYDAIIAGMSVTAERQEVINFTQAYTPPDPSAYLAQAADIEFGADTIVAAQTSTIQANFVAEQGWTLLEFATPEETVAAVRNGEADAVLSDKSFADTAKGDDLVMLERMEQIGGGVGMGFRKTDEELMAKFDEAIASVKADGTLNAMIEKWQVSSQW